MNIRNLTKKELNEYFIKMDEPKFRANQVFNWIHKNKINDFNQITNIKKDLILNLQNDFDIYTATIYKKFSSIDGSKKYLFKLYDNNIIETVLLKANYGFTVCISSQVGCSMGCLFCASTKNGFKRNLEVYELLLQYYEIKKDINVNSMNIVIMGSGEPLNNFSNLIKFFYIINDIDGENLSLRNITVSTCGIVEKIYELANMKFPITLALSLHAPNDYIRNKIMPISKKYKLETVFDSIKYYYKTTKRRITIEYSLIEGINSDINSCKELIDLLNKNFIKNNIEFNVNLIPINKIENCKFNPPSKICINKFKSNLEKNKIHVTIRRSQGMDISGSCGQLVSRHIDKMEI